MAPAGVPLFGLRRETGRYFDFHHTADDTFDKIEPASLDRAAAALAALQPPAEEPLLSVVTVADREPHDVAAEEAAYTLTCYRHPERITSLRCYNCNRPICISCAKKTPVGYICPECQRQAEDAFYNSRPLDRSLIHI